MPTMLLKYHAIKDDQKRKGGVWRGDKSAQVILEHPQLWVRCREARDI